MRMLDHLQSCCAMTAGAAAGSSATADVAAGRAAAGVGGLSG